MANLTDVNQQIRVLIKITLFSNILDLPLSLSDTFCQAKARFGLERIGIYRAGY